MSARRGRQDSHPLLRVAALAAALVATGLTLDGFGRCVKAALRAVGLL